MKTKPSSRTPTPRKPPGASTRPPVVALYTALLTAGVKGAW
jgi:hypothetical protein